jgi:hypothetical protein
MLRNDQSYRRIGLCTRYPAQMIRMKYIIYNPANPQPADMGQPQIAAAAAAAARADTSPLPGPLYPFIFHSPQASRPACQTAMLDLAVVGPNKYTSCRATPYMPPPNMPAPPCLPWASPCIFSLTLTLTSKNLDTQRSRHTDSPLFRSASRYDASMHFAEHDLRRLRRGVSCVCVREGERE